MSKAPSKKSLAEAGRRKLEAFKRAKAEGAAAKKTRGTAGPGADAEDVLGSAAPAANQSLPQVSQVSEPQAHASSAGDHAAVSLVADGARRQPHPGDASWAKINDGSAIVTNPAQPVPSTALEPAAGPQLTPAGNAATATWSQNSQLLAMTLPPAVLAPPSDSSSQAAQVGSSRDQQLPLAQQLPITHGATAAALPPARDDEESGLDVQQQTLPSGTASLPLPPEFYVAARLAERASFEASHSPFIAFSRTASGRLSRTASGRVSVGSATHDSEFGGDGTSRSSHHSRLASVTQQSDTTIAQSAAAPAAGLRQPWYAKLLAPAPEGTDSTHSTAADARAGSWQFPDATQHGEVGRPMPPDPSHPPAGSGAGPGMAAEKLGSALEAFMGIEDDEERVWPTAAQPLAVGSHQSAAGPAGQQQPSSASVLSIAAAPPHSASRTNGYAALADGYLSTPIPVEPLPSAVAGTEAQQGDLHTAKGGQAAAPTAPTMQPADAAVPSCMAELGRPVSFQDWAAPAAQQPDRGLPTGNQAGASELRCGLSSSGSATSSGHGRHYSSTADMSDRLEPQSHTAQQPLPLPDRAVRGQACAEQTEVNAMPASEHQEGQHPAGHSPEDSTAAQLDSAASGAAEQQLPAPRHSASAALANGISAWLAAPSTLEASSNGNGLRKADRSAAFLKELAASGPTSGSEARSSSALREHIDQLTREAFELRRGLTQQADLASTLAAENTTLTDDYNRERERTRELEATLERVQGEASAQGLALEALAAEREAARMAACEAADRIKVLAAEVVALEEARVAARAAELRASATARDAAEEARAAKVQAAKLAVERESLAAAVGSLQAEKQALRVKLRRTGGSADVAISTSADLQQQQQQQEQAVQDGAAPLHAAAADVAGAVAADANSGERRGAEAAAAAHRPESTADGVPARPTADQHSDSHAGSAVQQRLSSHRIAAAATAAASARAAGSNAQGAGPPVAVLQQLLPWRVAGPGSWVPGTAKPHPPAAVGGMSADEAVRWATQRHAAVLGKIHRTLESLAEEKRSCLAALEAQQAEVVEARAAARDARRKLATTQQRLELMVGRSMMQEGPKGVASSSAPASPAQPQRPPRPGSIQPRGQWMNGHSTPGPTRQQRSPLQ